MKCVRMEPLCAGAGALSGWWTGHKELLREQGYWPRTAAQRAHLSWLTPLFFRRWLHPSQGSSSLLAALFTGEASKQGLRHLCFTLINLKSFKKMAAQTDRQQLVRLWVSARCVFKQVCKAFRYSMCNLQSSDAIQVSQRLSVDLSSAEEISAPLTLLHPLSVDFWTQWSLHKGGIEAWFISATIALFLVPMVALLSTCTFFLYFICLHNYFVNGNFTRHPPYP